MSMHDIFKYVLNDYLNDLDKKNILNVNKIEDLI